MEPSKIRIQKRNKKKLSIRSKLSGTSERPRLTVFRSGKNIYAQLIDDVAMNTICSASTIDKEFKENNKAEATKSEKAEVVGKKVAQKALEKGIKDVVFDRNGYLYHGRVKQVADGARAEGLNF